MTSDSTASADSPDDLLAGLHHLTQRVRIAQRGTWFPLCVLASAFVLAIPVYRFAPHHTGPCRAGAPGVTVCSTYNPSVLAFWPVALVLVYVLVAAFYISQARRRGVGTRVGPYIAAGVALAALLAGASIWRALHPLTLPAASSAELARPHHGVLTFVTPATAVGVALLVLAWVEANRALLAFSLVFIAIVLVQAGRVIHSASPWYFLPTLILPAAVLLAGSALFAVLRPPTTPSSP